jgi:hypothetical protein
VRLAQRRKPNRILQMMGGDVQPPDPVKEQERTRTNQDGAADGATGCEPVPERPKRTHHLGERYGGGQERERET